MKPAIRDRLAFRSRTRAHSALWRLARVVVAVAALGALAVLRPNISRLDDALTAPMTAGDLKQFIEFALWCLAVGIAATAAVRAAAPRPRHEQRPRKPERRRPTRPDAGSRLRSPAPLILVRRPDPDGAQPVLRHDADKCVIEPANSDGPPVQIGLLGPFRLVTPTGRRIKRTATRDLIAYLALHPHGVTRDELLEALWPDGDPRRTRPRLWQSITEARKILGGVLHRDGERYVLDRVLVDIDIDALADLAGAEWPGPGGLDPTGIVRGVPLADIDAVWADAHRPRLAARAQEVLISAGHALLASQDHRRALDAAERGIALDELNEALWQIVLRAHAGLGARTAVTDCYQRLVTTLGKDLGIAPTRDTQILYRALLAEESAPTLPGRS